MTGQQLVAGRYRLCDPIGEGGMGRVWLAHDDVLRRDVAIKELTATAGRARGGRPVPTSDMVREAQTAAQISHPHVIRIYDIVYCDQVPWIVMEYFPSSSLNQIIRRCGALAPGYVATIGLAVLDALTAAHRAGVLHRDVTPHNILVGHDRRVVLTDFGLATWMSDSEGGAAEPVGTPAFVAPERAHHGESSVEGDLWSLGATLYTAVEGRSPYARPTVTETLSALMTRPPDPVRFAGELAPVLHGLLRREPSQRLSAVEARAALSLAAGYPGGKRSAQEIRTLVAA